MTRTRVANLADAQAIAQIYCAAAWAGASKYRPRTCYSGVAEFSVYVARDARGTGAGRSAMEALVGECESRGVWKLLSRVFPEN